MRQSIKQLILTFLLLLIGVTTQAFVQPSFPSDGYTGDPYYEDGYSIVQPGGFNMLGVSGYTEDGVMHDDGSPDHSWWGNFWENSDYYEYYWDEYNNQWLRKDPQSGRWDYWAYDIFFGWHWLFLYHHKPDEQHVQRAYQENPYPLDGETYILISLALLAFAGKFYYQKKKFQTISNSAV